MATAQPRVKIPREPIAAFCERWGVAELALFGSVLRDDFRPDSDIDIMVKFKAGRRPKLFGFVDMQMELEEILGRQVDLVEHGTIENPFRRASIMGQLAVLYAA